MAPENYTLNTLQKDDDSDIGLDDIINEAENDWTKVFTKTPANPFQLGYISVFCNIVNKMIGTSIFDNPSNIMNDTQSVGATLIFWLLGSIATIAGTLVFIEYGLTISCWFLDSSGRKVSTPKSGGEFNYLNYSVKPPKFLVSCIYGLVFV